MGKIIDIAVDPITAFNERPRAVPLEWWTEQYVLRELRKAGAPVEGSLELRLTSGVLTRDQASNHPDRRLRFSWRESA